MAKPGSTLSGTYQIIRSLGEGAMGQVFKARHLKEKKLYAVKMLHDEAATKQINVKRLEREAIAASEIQHPSIVGFKEVCHPEEGPPFLVMELLEGQTLQEWINETTVLPIPLAIEIVGQILDGLAAAHQKGIIHRDLKPSNIFILNDDEPTPQIKILDFGLAKYSSTAVSSELTQSDSIPGTPLYFSPEQARGRTDLDHRIDIYAVGAILFQCLTGQPPFVGENSHALLQTIINEPVPKMRKFRPEISADIENICQKALKKNRNKRYPDVQAMLRDLGGVDTSHQGQSPSRKGRLALLLAPVAMAIFLGSLFAVNQFSQDPQADETQNTVATSVKTGHPPPSTMEKARQNAAKGAQKAETTTEPSLPQKSVETTENIEKREKPSPVVRNKVLPGKTTIKIRVQPSSARLLVDGKKIDSNSVSLVFARSKSKKIRVEAHAKGYIAHRQWVGLEKNRPVFIRLKNIDELTLKEKRQQILNDRGTLGKSQK